MNDTYNALLRVILENPEDDNARLVMADWLEENASLVERPCSCVEYIDDSDNPWRGNVGYRPERDQASGRHDGGWTNCKQCNCGGPNYSPGVVRESNGFAERSEFIRVQIEITNDDHDSHGDCRVTDTCSRCARGVRLRSREQKLLRSNAVDWTPFLTGSSQLDVKGIASVVLGAGHVGGLGRVEMVWRRGFIESIKLNTADFLAHAASIFAQQPVTAVTLSDREPMCNDVGDWWGWSEMGNQPSPGYLPDCLYRLLVHDWMRRDSKSNALAALSRACVLYGRRAAKLE